MSKMSSGFLHVFNRGVIVLNYLIIHIYIPSPVIHFLILTPYGCPDDGKSSARCY